MTRLHPGSKAPALSVETLSGPWSLAEQTPETFSMVVFYRGLHCPACKAFLSQLEGLLPDYAATGTDVIAISMDTRARAEQSARDWGLEHLALGYGLTEAQARDWDLYLSESIKEAESPLFCEPALFLIDRDDAIYLVNIASMPWPRPDIATLPAKIRFATGNNYPPRGTKS
ncbi:redoxin domain-containing protein [Alkalilacustris brevis]|uniref:redoxin domain-containing protein n=1 Tax=Alkalilacustris brevis TaxID=2026338 RepID=UPI000E0D1550|nr:redoxin domain-containing protein [Alkalilacustris brevis]